MVDVRPETLSRCEEGERPVPVAMDLLVRAETANALGVKGRPLAALEGDFGPMLLTFELVDETWMTPGVLELDEGEAAELRA
jgi:hypothetical protein